MKRLAATGVVAENPQYGQGLPTARASKRPRGFDSRGLHQVFSRRRVPAVTRRARLHHREEGREGNTASAPVPGYIVAFPNPHGSTGFGQEYTASISGDWGGKPFEDVMKVTDALEKLPLEPT